MQPRPRPPSPLDSIEQNRIQERGPCTYAEAREVVELLHIPRHVWESLEQTDHVASQAAAVIVSSLKAPDATV